jgi:hypothetical protein
MIVAYQALGSTIKGQSVLFRMTDITQNLNIGAANVTRCYFVAVYLSQSATITGVKWYQYLAGNFTASHYNGVGLYSYSGGTLTLQASSTVDNNTWTVTSNTYGSKAFSSTYAAAAGIYYVALSASNSAATTVPQLGFGANVLNSGVNNGDFTNSAALAGFIDNLNTLPATQAISGFNPLSTCPWAAIY